jgi:hypothetical protein
MKNWVCRIERRRLISILIVDKQDTNKNLYKNIKYINLLYILIFNQTIIIFNPLEDLRNQTIQCKMNYNHCQPPKIVNLTFSQNHCDSFGFFL